MEASELSVLLFSRGLTSCGTTSDLSVWGLNEGQLKQTYMILEALLRGAFARL